MKKMFVILIGLTTTINVYSQTAEEWFQRGEEAYQEEKYDIAMDFYKKAADLGSIEACGVLSYMYYYGAVSTKINGKIIRRNTDMALLWAKRSGVNNNFDADIVLALTSYYDADFDKTIKILKYWKEEILTTEAKIALAISYMMNGSKLISFLEKQKAELLLKEVYNQWQKENEKPSYFYSASAILAKIEFEKNWKWTDNVQKYGDVFGEIGSDEYVFCPLAAYVMGRYYRNVVEYKDLGEKCIKAAAKYDYKDNDYKVLYPFAEEIKQEYDIISRNK